MPHKFTSDQATFIKENIKGTQSDKLTKMFNSHFGIELKQSQIRAYVKNHKLRSGVDAKFSKGHVPHTKGTHISGNPATQFKKGHRPHNQMSVGSEVINGSGYVVVKVAEPNKWRFKHLMIWEQHNGSIPKDHCVMFADGNKNNLDINNLILITRGQLSVMNRLKLIKDDADLTKTGIIIADIYNKISKINK